MNLWKNKVDSPVISGYTYNVNNLGQLTFSYNAHNRPISVSKNNTILENYTHDHEGRRIQEGNTITIYDGYNAIAEYSINGVLKTTYAWGLDLSNTLQGAGGVGGLLSVTDYTTQTPLVSYPTYDGNGNITEYVTEANNGTLATHYEYDSFGNVIRNTMNKNYRYQFSTKPYNKLTGLNYYNYRDYDPVSGRWISPDPIEEQGGLNLYGFVGNDAISSFDRMGLVKSGEPCSKCCKKCKKSGGKLSIQDSGTSGYNLKLSVTSPTFTSECKQAGKCEESCCYEYYRWSSCYTGRCFDNYTATFEKTIEATPGAPAWRAIAVNVKEGYAWCSCNEGVWECHDERESSNIILYAVDSEFKPTKWVLKTVN